MIHRDHVAAFHLPVLPEIRFDAAFNLAHDDAVEVGQKRDRESF